MRKYTTQAGIILLSGLWLLAGPSQITRATAHGHDEHGHPEKMAHGICTGFLVLPNGFAVMSNMHDMAHGRHKSHKQHAKSHHPMSKHLMGFKHGDPIPAKKGMLCVPVQKTRKNSWMAVSANPMLKVHVHSRKGALTHSSRENEAFDIQVKMHGKSVKGAKVIFLARMPHHDRTQMGGHGLSNDPEVQGLAARPQGNGYRVRTVDFAMGGAWLFEIRVTKGDKTYKAYFATRIGN